MKFNCFPKKQDMFLIYSNYKVFKSRLFADLTLQSSPKNSFFYRVLKSTIGFYISSIFRHSFSTPNANQNYIGIIKMDRYIFFELNSHNIPVNVWRKSSNQIWAKEQFIGFQLFSNYTLTEFQNKSSLKEYQNHPDHLLIKKFVGPICESRHQVDFEVNTSLKDYC